MTKGHTSEAQATSIQLPGLWTLPVVVFGLFILAAGFISVAEPNTTGYHIAGFLLATATAISLYVAYIWWRYAPYSIFFFGTLSLCCLTLAIKSF